MSILGLFSSCSADDMESTRQAQVSENVILKSGLSLEAFSELPDRIDAQFGQTRSSDIFWRGKRQWFSLFPCWKTERKSETMCWIRLMRIVRTILRIQSWVMRNWLFCQCLRLLMNHIWVPGHFRTCGVGHLGLSIWRLCKWCRTCDMSLQTINGCIFLGMSIGRLLHLDSIIYLTTIFSVWAIYMLFRGWLPMEDVCFYHSYGFMPWFWVYYTICE